jgi:phospholipid/cholesterol/gamma-HCH transport system ATP-binding protein
MIEIENLSKSFDGTEVLKGVSLRLAKGEILALIGGSGHGKTVILKHVAGLMKPDRGRVILGGQDVFSLRGDELEKLRSRLGFLFQGGALFTSLTVFDNVAFPLREKTDLGEDEIGKRVLTVLEQVGLKGAEDKYLARAIVRNPEIMLFDEPTTGLDPVIAHIILDLIQSVQKNLGFTGIIVSHELSRVFQIVHKVAMLHEGIVLFAGTPDEIMASRDPIVRQFITEALRIPPSARKAFDREEHLDQKE